MQKKGRVRLRNKAKRDLECIIHSEW